MSFLFTLLLLSPAAFGGAPMATGAAQAAFKSTIGANIVSIGGFLALPCVAPQGVAAVSGLAAATETALADVEAEYKDYMAFVTKPMDGSGKCDGGFYGVEVESHRRYERSLQAARRVQNIGNAYKAATMANLFGPIIPVNDSAGGGCLSMASSGYDGLEAGANSVLASIRSVTASMRYEAEQFAVYEARNKALRMRCDEHQEILDGMIKNAAVGEGSVRDPASIPGGHSPNPSSDITGTQEDAEKRKKAGDL